MLVSVFFEKDYPNRVIKAVPYSTTTAPCFIPGIEIRLKYLDEKEKSILSDPTQWVWTIHSGIGKTTPLKDSEIKKYELLSTKLGLVERLWMMALILDRSIYNNMIGSDIHEKLISWEFESGTKDEAESLTNYMAGRMNMDIDTYSKIYNINKDTYYRKVKELHVSILKIQDQIMSSVHPLKTYKDETSRLIIQARKKS
jgi:hypothetical protein